MENKVLYEQNFLKEERFYNEKKPVTEIPAVHVGIVVNKMGKGHQSFAFINVSEKYNFAHLRKKGFQKALKKYQIKFDKSLYRTTSLEDPSFSKEITIDLLRNNPELNCIICSTEYSSVGAIQACAELNKKIGEDISIITFDGPVVESLTNPKLTAISHPLEELGTNAINILLGSKKKKQISNYLVKPHIIERGSVKSLI